MAEVVTDEVARALGCRRRARTRDFPLDGTPPEPWGCFEPGAVAALRARHGLPDDAARHLVNRYGRRAADVAGYLARDPKLAQPIAPGEPDLRVELPYQREHEMALYPADHLLRRTRLGLFRPDLLRSVTAGVT